MQRVLTHSPSFLDKYLKFTNALEGIRSKRKGVGGR